MNHDEATHDATGTRSVTGPRRRSIRVPLVLPADEGDARDHPGDQQQPADHVVRTTGRQHRADNGEVRREEKEDQEERDRLNVAAEQGRSGLDQERDERNHGDRGQDQRRDAGAAGSRVESTGAAGHRHHGCKQPEPVFTVAASLAIVPGVLRRREFPCRAHPTGP